MKKEDIKIGTKVIYWSVINGKEKIHPVDTVIESEIWETGSGMPLCKVKGVSGGVYINHLDKRPTTLAGWQKVYPDAIQIKATSTKFLSNKQLREFADIEGKAVVLQDTSTGTWSSKSGQKVNIRAIVSKMAYKDENSTL